MAGYPVIETLNLDNLRFDNVSHYLTTTTCPFNDSKYVFSGDFTMEAWINMTALPTVGTWKYIIQSYNDISPIGKSFSFAVGRDLGGQLSLQYWVSTDGLNWSGLTSTAGTTDYKGTVNGPYQFQAATWYHVAACRTGNTLNLFVNGFLVGQSTTFTYTNFAGAIPITIGASATQSTYFNGYISNLRVVKGTAVYTAASNAGTTYYANSGVSYTNGNPDNTRSFIPPTVNLTATQSAGGGSTNINAIGGNSTVNTSLLVCQNTSSGSFTQAFVDNSSYAQRINAVGYLPNITRAPANNFAMPYPGFFATAFSGSAQYVSAPAATAWAMGTGDFTVEAWVYPNSLTAGTGIMGSWTGTIAAGTAATSAWALSMGTGNAANVRFSVSNGTTITGYESTTAGLTAGTWNHVAAVRIANTLNIYTNGVKTYAGAAGAETTNITVATAVCQVAAAGTSTQINGFVSNARVIKALGAYTNTFTPYFYPLANTLASNTGLTNYNTIPAAVGNTSGVQLLACRYRTISPEHSVNGWTMTLTGAPNVTANVTPGYLPLDNNYQNIVHQPKTASDVGPNFLTIPANTAYNLGTGAFTIEGWFHPTNPTAAQTLISSFPTNTFGAGYWRLGLTSGSLLSLTYDGSVAQQIINATSQALTGNSWNHVAVTRTITGANGVITFYVNGLAATNTVVANSVGQFGNSSAALWVGSQEYTGPTPPFTGYSNNIRITRGIAVYTGPFAMSQDKLATTQSAGTNIAAIASSANVALLIQANSVGAIADSSTTAATISLYGNPQSNTYGNNATTSNSVYTIPPNRMRLQYTAPTDIPVVKRVNNVLLNTASITAMQVRYQYAQPNDIFIDENKFTHQAIQSSVESMPKFASLPIFDNPIGTNLYKQPSTSYQFWS